MPYNKPETQGLKQFPTTQQLQHWVQIENEFGFCGQPDQAYLRHLADLVRKHLGPDVLIYTTDPPDVLDIGTLPNEVYSYAPAAVNACASKIETEAAMRSAYMLLMDQLVGNFACKP